MKKAGRIIALIAVIVVILAAIIASINIKPSIADQVWDTQTTVGNLDAQNYFVVYSDLACPYCIAFENAIVENEEEFQKYLEEHDILFEVRLTDYLYRYGTSNPDHSRIGAVAAFCAKNEGKFWDYYNHAVEKTWNDFYKTGGKEGGRALVDKGSTYWIDLGRELGLGDTFENCVENEETLAEVEANTEKAAKVASGMPYFRFNKFSPPGFDMAGDWDDVLMYFQAGLNS